MKIVIAPDSFKHSMSAFEVCNIISEAAALEFPGAEIIKVPIADGGEGTIDAILQASGGRLVEFRALDAEFNEITASYGLTADGTAVIELAAICGLMMVREPNPEKTTTYGVGQAILAALDNGCRRIILTVGGSSTNDGGIGALSALGVKFYDADGHIVKPNGAGLSKIVRIDSSGLDMRLSKCKFEIACDVDNPLYGERGAAYVFAPQKGANSEMAERLDIGLRNYAKVLERDIGRNVALEPGSGAAGGIPAGFLAYTGVILKSGIDIVLDEIGFDEIVPGAALVITGEGKTDSQTLGGKAICGVTRRAKTANVPVLVISGAVEDEIDEQLYDIGVRSIFACTRLTKSFDEVFDKLKPWLKLTARNAIRAFAAYLKN